MKKGKKSNMAKKKTVEKALNIDSILFNCRDYLRAARNSGSFFEKRDMMLTLVFLRFIGEKYEDGIEKLKQTLIEQGLDPEDENIRAAFFDDATFADGTNSIMSCSSQCNTLHTFSKTCVLTCSFFPSFASAFVVIPAWSLRSTFIIFSSINFFHNLLYLIAIIKPFRDITTIYYALSIISSKHFSFNLKLIFSTCRIYVKDRYFLPILSQ